MATTTTTTTTTTLESNQQHSTRTTINFNNDSLMTNWCLTCMPSSSSSSSLSSTKDMIINQTLIYSILNGDVTKMMNIDDNDLQWTSSISNAMILSDDQTTSPISTIQTSETVLLPYRFNQSVLKTIESFQMNPSTLSYPDLTQLPFVWLTFVLLYLMVMFSALFGNWLVCYTVLSNRKMQTVVNYYIVNLALCDFLIGAFVLPSKMLELLAPSSWHLLNNSICTVMAFLQTVIVFANILTLVATCFERYFAIVHPLKSRMQQSKRRTCRILIAVWLLTCFGSLPNFFSNSHAVMHQLDSDYGTIRRRTCLSNFESNFRTAYYTFLFVAFYLIPLSLIAFTSFCIARSLLRTSVLRRQGSLLRQEVNRRKVGKMILIVVLTFTIAWTPYFLVSIVTQYMSENFMEKHNFYFTMLCINLFAFLHSSINPLIYATMSTRFRKGFARIIRILLCCSSGTPSTNIGNQNSFNEQVTSSRGSIVNVNGTAIHIDRITIKLNNFPNRIQYRRRPSVEKIRTNSPITQFTEEEIPI